MNSSNYLLIAVVTILLLPSRGQSQTLEAQLLAESTQTIAADARQHGDATRGAIAFHLPHMACAKCHTTSQQSGAAQKNALGPNLTQFDKSPSDEEIVDAVLRPSKSIRKGFESITLITTDGISITGFAPKKQGTATTLRDVAQNGKRITVSNDDIEVEKMNSVSIMPAGQVNQLAGRQQFLDIVRYLYEIRDGGIAKARELQPPPHLLVARPIPAYEQEIDHAGMISDLDNKAFQRGEAIYNRLCINCHGTVDKPGSLPTSLRFATGKFKNGHDPYTMYRTLTYGFGMMLPQTWMVPQQKYDVIHYIREAYLKRHNPSQLFATDDGYLAKLPQGTSRGPAPSLVEPWVNMNYGPSLINTYEVGKDATNFAYKGLAVRVDQGPGGVSRGNAWTIFDHDTMRVAAAWSRPATGNASFIDWQGIHFNGRHAIHPRIAGELQFANPTGPGWANPADGSFDDPRFVGRDGRKYGPLPRDWAQLKGIYSHGPRTIVDYTVGTTRIHEMHGLAEPEALRETSHQRVFTRTLNLGPRDRDMLLQVATSPSTQANLQEHAGYVIFGEGTSATPQAKPKSGLRFDGQSFAESADGDAFDMTSADFTISALVKTRKDGTIFAKTERSAKWVPDGKTLFLRGGRLTYDIGWVGAAQGNTKINDGKPHHVAMTWDHTTSIATFYVDGKPDGEKPIQPKSSVKSHTVRIGYTAEDFPKPSPFQGDLTDVRFYQRRLSKTELAQQTTKQPSSEKLVGHWPLRGKQQLADASGNKHELRIVRGSTTSTATGNPLLAGYQADAPDLTWEQVGQRLCLRIPAGQDNLELVVWSGRITDSKQAADIHRHVTKYVSNLDTSLVNYQKGGPARWPERIETVAQVRPSDGPFAVDVLTRPASNPWLARVRLTGFDFYPDGDRMVVCAWDGDVWLVTGLSQLDKPNASEVKLTWQRIASGLFQPLGLKIVDDQIFVSCRDQICILRDLNDDGETDYYQCFNSDHQVTDHFHEFAMGLQTDAAGNFYYAKSARHALTALVPHHGTLLRVSKDGERTDILATGFRAANGVCLNEDGSFIVTDQEGHWNPKNRINWVKPGGFYGNMYGYHDVTDSSNEAMQQPLCWITNAFDRSPGELLWVRSDKWGPLNGSLLNLSYGYGQVYVVPHEEVNGQMQGGMCAFPIPRFPTGTMRGRFRPQDGQLYLCGMFAWAGNQQQGGGLYRLRYTGQPAHLPVKLEATQSGMRLTLTDEVTRESATNPDNYQIKVWSLRRTRNYGSKHYDEHPLKITAANLSSDGKTVELKIPGIAPTWCMEIKFGLQSRQGKPVRGVIHNTIHNLGD